MYLLDGGPHGFVCMDIQHGFKFPCERSEGRVFRQRRGADLRRPYPVTLAAIWAVFAAQLIVAPVPAWSSPRDREVALAMLGRM